MPIRLYSVLEKRSRRGRLPTTSTSSHNAHGTFAYVTVVAQRGESVRTEPFPRSRPFRSAHCRMGFCRPGDGTRIYTGLENGDRLVAINTLTTR